MTEFPDSSSFCGDIGALTVVGDIHRIGPLRLGWTYGTRFEVAKRLRGDASHESVAALRTLYALRWSVVRFEGSGTESLVFETIFHGDWEQYLRKLVTQSGRGINFHAAGTTGYPGLSSVEVFLRYLFEHHRPAAHVFAAIPYASPIDLQLALASDTPQRQFRCRWFGSIVRLRPGARGDVEAILAGWSPSDSPLVLPETHHGRVVLVERAAETYILVNLAYVAERGSPREDAGRRRTDLFDAALVQRLVTGPHADAWKQLMSACVTPASSTGDMICALMSRRYGHREWGRVQWADDGWEYPPAQLLARITARMDREWEDAQ